MPENEAMRTGISGLILPADWDFETTLREITAAGYDSFEIALRDSGRLSIESPAAELRDARKAAASAGVKLTGICPAFRNRPKDLMNAKEEIRRESIRTFESCIHIAETLEIDTILLVLGQLTPELYYDVAYDNALAGMRVLSRLAERTGVRLAIEYVWNKFLLSPMEFARFCDDVGSRHVGFYFDSGNMAMFGYPEQWVRICGRHLMAVHVKDFQRRGCRWTPLLEGDVDFEAVVRELRAIDFAGPLVSEVDLDLASLSKTAAAIERIKRMGIR